MLHNIKYNIEIHCLKTSLESSLVTPTLILMQWHGAKKSKFDLGVIY